MLLYIYVYACDYILVGEHRTLIVTSPSIKDTLSAKAMKLFDANMHSVIEHLGIHTYVSYDG